MAEFGILAGAAPSDSGCTMGSEGIVVDELAGSLGAAVCGCSVPLPGLGVLDSLASLRSKSCESSLGRIGRVGPVRGSRLTDSTLFLYTTTGEFSTSWLVTGGDLPIVCQDFVRLRSCLGEVAFGCVCSAPVALLDWPATSCTDEERERERCLSSVGLDGRTLSCRFDMPKSSFKLSISLARMSSRAVFRGMYGVDAITDALFKSKLQSSSNRFCRELAGVPNMELLCESGLFSIGERGYPGTGASGLS